MLHDELVEWESERSLVGRRSYSWGIWLQTRGSGDPWVALTVDIIVATAKTLHSTRQQVSIWPHRYRFKYSLARTITATLRETVSIYSGNQDYNDHYWKVPVCSTQCVHSGSASIASLLESYNQFLPCSSLPNPISSGAFFLHHTRLPVLRTLLPVLDDSIDMPILDVTRRFRIPMTRDRKNIGCHGLEHGVIESECSRPAEGNVGIRVDEN